MSLPASRCPGCQRVDVPPSPRCPACAQTTDESSVPPRGTVVARTRRPGGPWIVLVVLQDGARVLTATSDQALTGVGESIELVHDEVSGLLVPRERSSP